MSWSISTVPESKVWKVFSNINTSNSIPTADLQASVEKFIADWKKSFTALDSFSYNLLAARKGTSELFIYFDCEIPIGFSNINTALTSSTIYYAPYLLLTVLYQLDILAQVPVKSDGVYGVYNGITTAGSPISETQTFPSLEAMKLYLESLGWTCHLVSNVPVEVNPVSTIVYNPSLSQPVKYDSISTPSQLINAVLNKQGLREIVDKDNTGLSSTYYDVLYALSYIVNTRSYPKFVT